MKLVLGSKTEFQCVHESDEALDGIDLLDMHLQFGKRDETDLSCLSYPFGCLRALLCRVFHGRGNADFESMECRRMVHLKGLEGQISQIVTRKMKIDIVLGHEFFQRWHLATNQLQHCFVLAQ